MCLIQPYQTGQMGVLFQGEDGMVVRRRHPHGAVALSLTPTAHQMEARMLRNPT
mgnify:FL=1